MADDLFQQNFLAYFQLIDKFVDHIWVETEFYNPVPVAPGPELTH